MAKWQIVLLLPALLVVLSLADDSSECGRFEWRNPETGMCECEENYGYDSSRKCIYCIYGRRVVIRENDGSRICTCGEGYLLNANGGCDKDTSVYGFGFCFVGFLMISLMGLVCGYVVRQYKNDGYNPCANA